MVAGGPVLKWQTLPTEWLTRADDAARVQEKLATKNRRRDTFRPLDGSRLDMHIRGMRAEALIAWTYGLEWEPVRPRSRWHYPDVGGVDVRSTKQRQWPRMFVYEPDEEYRPFVLVIVDGDRLAEAGWCYGIDAKQSCYWDAMLAKPCFAVPQAHLASPETLPIGDRLPKWCK